MERILIVGCGDIALRIVPMLRGRCQLFGLVRNPARIAGLRAAGIVPIRGDLDDRTSLARIAGLAHTVLHFAPPSSIQRGRRSLPLLPREGWGEGGTAATGDSERDFRTSNLLAVLSRGTLPQRLVYISTSGVYGDCGGAHVSETHALNAQNARAQRRVDAERQIRAWAKRNKVNASILRVPGIYADDRLPLERLRTGTPAIVAEEDSYTNHIHADDLARIIVAALHHAKPNRVYHASDDSEMKMGDYFDAVADGFDLPRPRRLPRAEVQRAVSPMLWSFMNESRRLTNARMKEELKVALRYPTVAHGLAAITPRC